MASAPRCRMASMPRANAPGHRSAQTACALLVGALVFTAGCAAALGIGDLDVVDEGGVGEGSSGGSGSGGDVDTGSNSGSSSGFGGSSSGGASSSGGGSGGVKDSGSSGGNDGASSGSGKDTGPMNSESGTEGGSDGPTGACTDSADETVENGSAFKTNAADCAIDNEAEEPATDNCLVALGLSTSCAACWDTLLQCSLAHCVGQCGAAITSSACIACELANCAVFVTCSGLQL
jgi:hypothetical protein